MTTRILTGAVAATVCFLLIENAAANLAAVSASDIQRTGNIVLKQKADVRLDYEKLAIRLDAEIAAVSVEYAFFNSGDDTDVTVGFPVDLMPPHGDGTAEYNIDHWREDSLMGFQIYDGSDHVPIEKTLEEPLAPEDRPRAIHGLSTKRRWSIATLHFKRGEHKSVRVDYAVRCIGVDSGFESTTDGSEFTPRTFLYSLRPARTWGNGRIGKLDVIIDTSFLRLNQFKIVAVEPKPQGESGGILRWSVDNLDLKTAPDFFCTYDATPALFQRWAERVRFDRFDNLRLKVFNGASANAKTEPLLDRIPDTVWLGSGKMSGLGATFEFRPRKDTYVSQVAILNGCWISETQYDAHARIKKLRIEYLVRFGEGPKRERSEQILPNRKFEQRALRFPAYYADLLDLPGGPEGILEEIKLTVLELYPGTESKPLAISDLYVYGNEFHGR